MSKLDKKLYKVAEAKFPALVDEIHNDYMRHIEELKNMGLYSDIEDIDPIDEMFADVYFSHLVLIWIVTRNNMLIRNIYVGVLKPTIIHLIRKVIYIFNKVRNVQSF